MKDYEGNMDDASEEGLQKLVMLGNKMFNDNLEKIKKLDIYFNQDNRNTERISFKESIKNKNN